MTRQLTIWFQGSTGSGKTVVSDLIKEFLEAKGVRVKPYVFGGKNKPFLEPNYIDETDVLTVEFDGLGDLEKLLQREVVA